MAASMDVQQDADNDKNSMAGLDVNTKVDDTYVTTNIKTAMLDRLSSSDAHFKHQQRGEPDLTKSEKYFIAETILDSNKATFLSRFGKYLSEDDLEYFSPWTSDYMVNYYVNDIRQHLDSRRNAKEVKNRRFQAMKEMVSKGTYFSELEMKARNPLLYEQMIGQFLTEEEGKEVAAGYIDKSDLRFSSVLMGFIENKYENVLHDWQKEKEDDQAEEEESEEESDEDTGDQTKFQPSELEKLQLRNEFAHIMKERFLEGQDKEFDYRDIDSNTAYDPLDILEHDEEDKYFADEDPESITLETDSNSSRDNT